jgi:excisionase family DNA binding protein
MHNPAAVFAPNIPLARFAYSLAESEALSGLSRSSLYRLIAAGELRTIKRGMRRLVPSTELERLCGVGSSAA